MIKELLQSGKTLQEVADVLGVSKQRVHQLVKKLGLSREEYVSSLRAKKRKENRLVEIQKKYNRDSYGFLSDIKKRQGLFFTRKKQNNKQRGWEWSITMSDLEWPRYCPILGIELDWFAEVRSENSPSIDRLDSSKGYIPGNVVIMSWRANRIKNDGTANEHQQIADYLNRVLTS